jgi:hypothetical protein
MRALTVAPLCRATLPRRVLWGYFALTNALDKSLQLAMNQIPECVAIGYVDIATGILLSVKTVDSHPQEVLDLVSAATADLFQGANVTAIESMFKRARGINADSQHYFQEIVVFSENLLHMFLRCKKNVNHVLVFVCRKSANVGMVIVKSRIALQSVDGTI